MFGTSGVRGPVGEAVTAPMAVSVGRAVATAGATRVVVGRDARTTGSLLSDALSAGARECGADVVDVGRVSTPTLARAVEWCEADAGVAVTASHNPPDDNGFKLWTDTGRALPPSDQEALAAIVDREAYDLADWDDVGRELAPGVDPERCHRRRLRAVAGELDLSVVVDVGNGVGRLTADALSRAGASVRTIDAQPDGHFPGRQSEPTAEAVSTLCTTVGATDADLGIAHDGDADRTVAVDESGSYVSGDDLLAVFAREAVGTGDRVAVPVDASLAVADVVTAAGGDVVRTRVGDVHVAAAATAEDVVFGGEASGAFLWPDETLCPDGPYAACRLAALVADRGPLSVLVAGVPDYPIRRESVPVEDREAAMTAVEAAATERFDPVADAEGVSVRTDEGWLLVRASGTEPVVRLTAEATDPDRADDLLAAARDLVATAPGVAADALPATD
jgi:phosphoglucosamine mutase